MKLVTRFVIKPLIWIIARAIVALSDILLFLRRITPRSSGSSR